MGLAIEQENRAGADEESDGTVRLPEVLGRSGDDISNRRFFGENHLGLEAERVDRERRSHQAIPVLEQRADVRDALRKLHGAG
jgi:hypothetical protein